MVDLTGRSPQVSFVASSTAADRQAPAPPRAQRPRVVLPGARRSPWGIAISLLFHATIIGLIIQAHWREVLGWEEVLAPGPVAPGRPGGGGGGGGGVRMIAMPFVRPAPAPPPPAATPPPLPAPVAPVLTESVPQELPMPHTTVPAAERPDSAGSPDGGEGSVGSGGGRGGGSGTGDGTGTGSGTGPGVGGGRGGAGGKGTPPQPRQLILPPLDYPGSLRGQTIAVTFWVARDGKVERVKLDPDVDDRGFAKRFVDVLLAYRFRPARSPEGEPIPGTTTVTISF